MQFEEYGLGRWFLFRVLATTVGTTVSAYLLLAASLSDFVEPGTIWLIMWWILLRSLLWQAIAIVCGWIFEGFSTVVKDLRSVLFTDLVFVILMITIAVFWNYWLIPQNLQNTQVFGSNFEPYFKDGLLTIPGFENLFRQTTQSIFATLLSWAVSCVLLITQITNNSNKLR